MCSERRGSRIGKQPRPPLPVGFCPQFDVPHELPEGETERTADVVEKQHSLDPLPGAAHQGRRDSPAAGDRRASIGDHHAPFEGKCQLPDTVGAGPTCQQAGFVAGGVPRVRLPRVRWAALHLRSNKIVDDYLGIEKRECYGRWKPQGSVWRCTKCRAVLYGCDKVNRAVEQDVAMKSLFEASPARAGGSSIQAGSLPDISCQRASPLLRASPKSQLTPRY